MKIIFRFGFDDSFHYYNMFSRLSDLLGFLSMYVLLIILSVDVFLLIFELYCVKI